MRKNQEKAAEVKKVAKAESYENSIALHAAEQYARTVIVNPDEHLDAVESTITDFMAGVEWSTNNNSINLGETTEASPQNFFADEHPYYELYPCC